MRFNASPSVRAVPLRAAISFSETYAPYFPRPIRSHQLRARIAKSAAPFGGADQVFSYLSRYTHRVGISNARIRKQAQLVLVDADDLLDARGSVALRSRRQLPGHARERQRARACNA
jgi:hypothetical protein